MTPSWIESPRQDEALTTCSLSDEIAKGSFCSVFTRRTTLNLNKLPTLCRYHTQFWLLSFCLLWGELISFPTFLNGGKLLQKEEIPHSHPKRCSVKKKMMVLCIEITHWWATVSMRKRKENSEILWESRSQGRFILNCSMTQPSY